MDCPAKVIVMGVDSGLCAEPIAHTIASSTASHADLARSWPPFKIVAILISAVSLLINILGFGPPFEIGDPLGQTKAYWPLMNADKRR
jgi:hypothetical protein